MPSGMTGNSVIGMLKRLGALCAAIWRVLFTAKGADWGPPVVAGLPGPLVLRRAITAVCFGYLAFASGATWFDIFVPAFAIVLFVMHLLPWLVSKRAPLTAWRVAIGLLLALTVLSPLLSFPRVLPGYPALERPWTIGALALIPAFFEVAARAPRRDQVAIGIVSVGVTLLATAIPLQGSPDSAFPPLIALIAVVYGVSRGQVNAVTSELAWVRRDMVDEQAKTAVLAERARIARELHDIIAHHLSMIAVRTDSAPYRLSISDESVRAELTELGDAARQALSETRGLLGVLRASDDGPELRPQPTVDDLPELVAEARNSGVPVQLTIEGESAPAPSAVGLAVYRVVQEALSNARRHAPGAPVQVWLRRLSGALHLVVDNDPGRAPVAESGPGNGITGMRERVAIVGGSFQAGPRADGGYTVRATIPLAGKAEGEA